MFFDGFIAVWERQKKKAISYYDLLNSASVFMDFDYYNLVGP